MEHLLDVLDSDSYGLLMLGVFCAGILLWAFWALAVPRRRPLRTLALFLILLGGELFFIGALAGMVSRAMHGTACVMYWRLLHTICHSHATSPGWFWASVVVLSVCGVLLTLMLLVLLVRLVTRGDLKPAARLPEPRRERSAGNAGGSGHSWLVLLVSTIVIVIALLVWIGDGLHHRSGDVRKQVAQALASTVPAQHAVAIYLRRHHALPADNAAAGLPTPSDMNGPHVRVVRIRKGVILVTFDATRAAGPIRGNTLMLVPVRHRFSVTWRCTSLDIDDRYLPGPCGAPSGTRVGSPGRKALQ